MKNYIAILLIVCLCGCDTLPDIPIPPSTTTTTTSTTTITQPSVIPQPATSEIIRGLMASDMIQMKDITSKKNDLTILREKGRYNTIYCPLDLAIIHNGQGAGTARPHIEAGRMETTVTDLAVKNINYIYNQGFRVMVVCGNEPSVRHGWSHLMSGLGFKAGLKNSDLYTSSRLANEKKCLTDLINKSGGKLFGMMLYLEPSVESSISFCKELAKHIRSQGYKGRLYSNGIGKGQWWGDASLDVRPAPSKNSLNDWNSTTASLKSRNADGMASLNAQTAPSMLPQMTSKLGPDGGILYFEAYKGNANGAQKLEDWMWKYNKW